MMYWWIAIPVTVCFLAEAALCFLRGQTVEGAALAGIGYLIAKDADVL